MAASSGLQKTHTNKFFRPSAAFLICAVLALIPLWSGTYLPLTDLPQHSAQIKLLSEFYSSAGPYHDWFQLNLLSPYAGSIILGSFLAIFLPVLVSVKVLLSALALFFVWSLRQLLIESEGDADWAILGFPLFFGANFFWGHLSFLFSAPMAFLTWAAVLRYQRDPQTSNAVKLSLLFAGLFFFHLLSFVLTLGFAVFFLLDGKNLFTQVRRWRPLAPGLILFLVWGVLQKDLVNGSGGTKWELGLNRLMEIPQLIIGLKGDGASQLISMGFLFVFLLFPKQRKSGFRWWIPAAAVGAICFLGPYQIQDRVHFFAERFTVFLVPAVLIALKPESNSSIRKRGAIGIGTGLFLIYMGLLAFRVVGFNREARDFEAVLASMDPGKKVSALVYERESKIPSYLPYVHFPAYYQVKKGGIFEFSFSNNFQQAVVYKPGRGLPAEAYTYTPEQVFNDPAYDYVLLRTSMDVSKLQNQNRILASHTGTWWVFKSAVNERSGPISN